VQSRAWPLQSAGDVSACAMGLEGIVAKRRDPLLLMKQ
jgi:hypothetical protein